MTRQARPWQDVTVLLVDGNNLLHAVAGDAGPASLRGLLPRLVAAVPPDVDALLILDGTPDPGAPSRMRIRRGLAIRHAGRVSADAVIVQLVEAKPFEDRAGVLVVTNDLALTELVRHTGGRARPVRWLEERLGEPAVARAPGASIGGPRPAGAFGRTPEHGGGIGTRGRWGAGGSPGTPGPASSAGPMAARDARRDGEAGTAGDRGPDGERDAVRPAWAPGRGATRKRGNPHRGH
ncbi:MAG TPA: hypothetical protein VN800_00240 [Candidatus Acidoferrales bacterium]|nr:hypothetical protein [Candidatus Acidoferrales bacterium]